MGTSKKASKRRAENRDKKARPTDRHAGKCAVCNHVEKEEIERRYMAFESPDEIATDFEIHRDAIFRHANYYGLNRKRVENTERVLEAIIAKGMTQLVNVEPGLVMDSIRELNKMRGKHKLPDENPQAAERFKRRYERAVRKYIEAKLGRGEDCSREEAIAVLGQIEPEINDYVN